MKITESKLRRIIREVIAEASVMNEGLWDSSASRKAANAAVASSGLLAAFIEAFDKIANAYDKYFRSNYSSNDRRRLQAEKEAAYYHVKIYAARMGLSEEETLRDFNDYIKTRSGDTTMTLK